MTLTHKHKFFFFLGLCFLGFVPSAKLFLAHPPKPVSLFSVCFSFFGVAGLCVCFLLCNPILEHHRAPNITINAGYYVIRVDDDSEPSECQSQHTAKVRKIVSYYFSILFFSSWSSIVILCTNFFPLSGTASHTNTLTSGFFKIENENNNSTMCLYWN